MSQIAQYSLQVIHGTQASKLVSCLEALIFQEHVLNNETIKG